MWRLKPGHVRKFFFFSLRINNIVQSKMGFCLTRVPNLRSKHVGPAGPLSLHYDVPVGQAPSIGPYSSPQTYISENTAHRPTGS